MKGVPDDRNYLITSVNIYPVLPDAGGYSRCTARRHLCREPTQRLSY